MAVILPPPASIGSRHGHQLDQPRASDLQRAAAGQLLCPVVVGAGDHLWRLARRELRARRVVYAGRFRGLHPRAEPWYRVLALADRGAAGRRGAGDDPRATVDPAPVPPGPAVQLSPDVRRHADPAGCHAPAVWHAGPALPPAGRAGRGDEPGADLLSELP